MLHPALTQIRIVLVNTSHPGNIGATARAMHTMGLSSLYLVNPQHFPDPDATARAAGGDGVLTQAQVVSSLEEALQGCGRIWATSALSRHLPWPIQTPKQAAPEMVAAASQQPVAVVFGCERNGLTNEELQACHYHIQIPTQPDYGTLNLAAAVQIICYEIFSASHNPTAQDPPVLATFEEVNGFYGQLEQVIEQVGFLDRKHSGRLLQWLKRLLAKTQLEPKEVTILRGILTAISRRL